MHQVAIAMLLVTSCGLYYGGSERDCASTDICDGLDNDCDGSVDEDFSQLGSACGCDGTFACSADGHGVVCREGSKQVRELCNGKDDDCDPATPDGADEPYLGTPCDGSDADACDEGSIVCLDGHLVCNEITGANVEQCNGLDDDCDGEVDEGFDFASDTANCGYCGHVCHNANGPIACTNGTCTPTCAPGAEDCNADPDDGCEVFRNRNPTCTSIAATGSVVGDAGAESIELTGSDEAIVEVTVVEASNGDSPVTATIDLDAPPGVNFDLYVYCSSCGGAIMGSATQPAGVRDEVLYRYEDHYYVDDTQKIYIEVRYASATTCGDWTVTVAGHTNVAATTCGTP
jgi:hypothetical protein